MHRLLIPLAGLAVFALGWFAMGFFGNKDAAPINAIGGTWSAGEVVWENEADAWRVSVVASPVRVRLTSTNGTDILNNLCGAILTTLVNADTEQVKRQNVYRVDLNFVMPDGKNAFPRMVPIPVKEGACVMDEFGKMFLPVLPEPAADWYLEKSGLQKNRGKNVRTVVFRPRPASGASIKDFPFLEACGLVVRDPLAAGAVQSSDGNVTFEAIREGQELSLLVLLKGPANQVSVGAYRSEVFRTTADGCERVEA